ncbi:biotin/lipoyl-binding protein [Chloroflexota bacterium]
MKNRLITAILLVIVLSTLGFAGCGGEQPEAAERQVTTVERGDLIVTIPADGNLDMPREVQLKFGAPGTVKTIYVEKGQRVKEGTLLAKLDDATQKLAIASAQYNVELAMNELVEKIHPALMGYPESYPDTSAVLRVEQAQEELGQAQKFLEQDKHQEAAAELRLAIHDLEASYKMLNVPEIATSLQRTDTFTGLPIDNYPIISKAIKLLEQDLVRLAKIQTFLEQGNYEDAKAELNAEQSKLKATHQLVKGLSGKIRISQRIGECCGPLSTQGLSTIWIPNPAYQPFPWLPLYDPRLNVMLMQRYDGPGTTGLMPVPYPDTSTALDWLRQVEEELQRIQACKEGEGCDELELATLLRIAQHDVEMSQTILEDNELIFRGGLNLKALRAYNLNLQIAEQDLKRYKDELMKTEILAPFDGAVVDIGVKENDQLSSFDYSSKTAVYLIDTRTVEMDGVIDEIDIYKVELGQEAIIFVDALPDAELKGTVIFVSPFGTQETGIVEFPVTISLEPTDIELKGGLTATADIIVEAHENVLLIPDRSIKGSPGDYWVEVVIDEEKLTTEKRPVLLGAQGNRLSEVVSGLSEGERIIVETTRGRIP